ncbi:hypothetical protein LINPERPRIM_LOCUS30322, partial [Linum perenne]
IVFTVVSFYESLLGTKDTSLVKQTTYYYDKLIIHKLDPTDGDSLCRPLALEEVKNAMFSINGDRSPDPNGFSFQFYKYSWDLLKLDVLKVVQDLFAEGKLNKQVMALESATRGVQCFEWCHNRRFVAPGVISQSWCPEVVSRAH